jgi:dihydroorotate dehydrogenase electron transfer subunit
LPLPRLLSSQSPSVFNANPSPSAAYPIAEQTVAVVSNEPVNSEYRHLIVSGLRSGTTGAAGQFFHILCPSSIGDSPYLRRPMSIYACDPRAGTLEFLYKVTGAGTRGLATLKSGDNLNVLGPLGIGFSLSEKWRGIAVVGRGVGLATLAPLAAMAQQQNTSVTAILSARTPEVLMSEELFRSHGATVLSVTDSEGNSGMRNVERLLRTLMDNGTVDALFTCGSRRLTAMLQRLSREANIPGQVAVEQQMACGLGMCFCCVKTFRKADTTQHRRVCLEGPVFDLAEVLP